MTGRPDWVHSELERATPPRFAVFLVNTLCRPINALLALADRDVCRWVELTNEDET